MSYISFEDVCKDYPAGNTVVHASDHVNFQIEKGEFCVVLGPSGAGKTTVLNLLGGMDKATSGRIIVGDKEITGLRSPQLTEYRRHDVGFVFQFYNLMPSLTALETSNWRSRSANVRLIRVKCWSRLDWDSEVTTSLPSSPAASSSVYPLPARYAKTRRCCSATSRLARWTAKRANKCWIC